MKHAGFLALYTAVCAALPNNSADSSRLLRSAADIELEVEQQTLVQAQEVQPGVFSTNALSFGQQMEFKSTPCANCGSPDLDIPECAEDQGSTTNRNAVCVIDKTHPMSGHSGHIPHAAQMLLPCWSDVWAANPSLKPVLLLKDGLYGGITSGPWIKWLLDQMEIRVIDGDEQLEEANSLCNQNTDVMKQPQATSVVAVVGGQDNALHLGDGTWSTQWLSSIESAHALRNHVVGKLTKPMSKPLANGKVRVGVVNRQGSRKLISQQDIVLAMAANNDIGLIDVVMFEDMEMDAQAAFMASHDIVVAPHGAGLTNLLFAQDCTVVLEMFPHNYFWPSYFGSLAVECGLDYFWMHPSTFDQAMAEAPSDDWTEHGEARKADIDVGAKDIALAMPNLVGARNVCRQKMGLGTPSVANRIAPQPKPPAPSVEPTAAPTFALTPNAAQIADSAAQQAQPLSKNSPAAALKPPGSDVGGPPV